MTDNQTMSKPREFWIRPRRIGKGPTWNCTDNLMSYAGRNDIIHVIEYSAYEALKIDNNSWKNCQRKLNEANERIVEFESIKSGHLKIQEEMQKQLEAAKFEIERLKEYEFMYKGLEK